MATLTVAALSAVAVGHSSLINPIPRNAIDNTLWPWKGGHWDGDLLPYNATCEHRSGAGTCWACTCTNASEPCDVGQTCLWFSEGCSIGCATCDGQRHPNGSLFPSNPNRVDRCGSGMKPTNNDPYYRTFNRDVPAMSSEDWTQHNPWRAPGAAPVYDSCGMAGGSPEWTATQLSFIDTKNAKQGDKGSEVLPKMPTGIVWTAGATVETKWGIRANHGGGYQYRLCPANETLNEACFRQHAVPFANDTYLEWGNGTRLSIESRLLSSPIYNGTGNSTWKMNPLPYGKASQAPEFDPPCHETVDPLKNHTGLCSGQMPWDVAIIDTLVVPSTLPPGDYVLGFRWDCEETAQIWLSCADISIAAAGTH
eukprot:m.178828 g.178828  ORF g.178828 m.178828 type:complete len:366 (+) comp14632_c0_seq1:29-1126(+)